MQTCALHSFCLTGSYNSTMTKMPPRPRSRFLRFSIRALLLLLLLVAVLLGWTTRKVREQGIVVAALEEVGCIVGHDYSDRPSTMLERLRLWSGEKEPRYAYSVDFSLSQVTADYQSHVTDAELAYLRRLPHLGVLYFNGTDITDAGLANISRLTELNSLSLNDTRVTDAGLVHIERLKQLETLELSGTQITDDGLAHLRVLMKLRELNLSGTHVTDAGLVHLEGLTQLMIVYLGRTQVTDDGARKLQTIRPNSWVNGFSDASP